MVRVEGGARIQVDDAPLGKGRSEGQWQLPMYPSVLKQGHSVSLSREVGVVREAFIQVVSNEGAV
eukprot:16082275-Heterocapsa_arctica.AAC.1